MNTKAAFFALFAVALFASVSPASAGGRDRDYYGRDNNRDCRDYTRTVNTKYGQRSVQGTACETRNGAWRIVSESGNNEGKVFILQGNGFNNVLYVDGHRHHNRPSGNISFHGGYDRHDHHRGYGRGHDRHDHDDWRRHNRWN